MKNQGWHRQLHMKVDHYFRNGKTLCRTHALPKGAYTFRDNPYENEVCKTCLRKLRSQLTETFSD